MAFLTKPKKAVCLVVMILMCFSFVACSGNNIETTTRSTQAMSQSTTLFSTESTVQTTASPSTESAIETSTETATTEITTSTTATETTTETTTTQTTATTAITTETATQKPTVFLEINCEKILSNMDKFDSSKKDFLSDDGLILTAEIPFEDGETAFDILKKACSENSCNKNCRWCKNGIRLETSFTPAYRSYYIEGIHQIYEFDCGRSSGWMYSVNGVFPDVSSSEYKVNQNDKISFLYTCEMGDDLR